MKVTNYKYKQIPQILTLMSQYIDGYWIFSLPTASPSKRDSNGVLYFKMFTVFGICTQFAKKPSNTVKRGGIGDYLVQGPREYDIMSASTFETFFPARLIPGDSNKTAPRTSADLNDPNFLDNVITEYDQGTSNIPAGYPIGGGGGGY